MCFLIQNIQRLWLSIIATHAAEAHLGSYSPIRGGDPRDFSQQSKDSFPASARFDFIRLLQQRRGKASRSFERLYRSRQIERLQGAKSSAGHRQKADDMPCSQRIELLPLAVQLPDEGVFPICVYT